MKAGDVCEIEVEGVGVLRNRGREFTLPREGSAVEAWDKPAMTVAPPHHSQELAGGGEMRGLSG